MSLQGLDRALRQPRGNAAPVSLGGAQALLFPAPGWRLPEPCHGAVSGSLPRGSPSVPGGFSGAQQPPLRSPDRVSPAHGGTWGTGTLCPHRPAPHPRRAPRLQQLLLPPAPRCPWQGTRWKWSLSASASLGPPCPWDPSPSCRAGLGQSWAGTELLVLLGGVTMSHGHPQGTGTVSLPSAPPSRQVTGWEVRSFWRGEKPLTV